MLIALPIIYVAAALYNGEDPVANVKGWLGMHEANPVGERYEEPIDGDPRAETDASLLRELQDENQRLRDALIRCETGSGSE